MTGPSIKNRMGYEATKLLRLLPAEIAHHLGLEMITGEPQHHLNQNFFLTPFVTRDVDLNVSVEGLFNLPHPVGLAAGFDKNAKAVPGLFQMGFSFAEVGGVTPLPQPGNPKPRVFRQPSSRTLINRMGLNNDGASVVSDRLRQLPLAHLPPLGVNISKNKDTPNERAIDDFLQVVALCPPEVNFFVVNISSPNTAGLRHLAEPGFIESLSFAFGKLVSKTFIKLDPDLDRAQFQQVVEAVAKRGFKGLVLTNTHRVEVPEKGGLSGPPLTSLSNEKLEQAWQVHKGHLAMIGSGGVWTGLDILEKLRRGASCVEIYTAFVYRGPNAVWQMLEELVQEMKLRGYRSLTDIIGSYY